MTKADKPTYRPPGSVESLSLAGSSSEPMSPPAAPLGAAESPRQRDSNQIAAIVAAYGVSDDVRASLAYRLSKRLLDVVAATLGLILLLPLFIIVALLIRLDSPGPAFFVQARVGQQGRIFHMIKFRTMVDGSELRLRGRHKRPDDERITRVGRWLRRTSVDEMPQLVNVLLGQMSLVGPRPELPEIVLQRYAPWQYQRFSVPQGMTGWWQVTGRGAKLLCEHTDDDLYYIAHASFRFDLRILAMTVRAVYHREGAF